jgi:hypothetical protein
MNLKARVILSYYSNVIPAEAVLVNQSQQAEHAVAKVY